ncbi:MAG: GNAT family N-acetyltransferase [Pseudanabaenaceae cyanobacterium]
MTFIAIAVSDAEIESCYGVIKELRPHLDRKDFVKCVRQMEQNYGYKLAYLIDLTKIKSVAGFRLAENLAWGKYLYIDDLVTLASDRTKGYGTALFQWLVDHARLHACGQIHLDSGVQRFDAHRFCTGQGMGITSHHFAMRL